MLASRLLPFPNILSRTTALNFNRRALLSTLNTPKVYAAFFKKYNCAGYTFEPGKPPEQEFQLLAKARQWGAESTIKHQKFLGCSIRLAEFFERFEDFREDAGGYTYSPDTEYALEFKRLCTVKRWDEGRIADVKKEYEKLMEASNHSRDGDASSRKDDQAHENVLEGKTAIAKFFIENQCPGYSYNYRSSVVEFFELVEARTVMWEEKTGDRKRTGTYEKTAEYKDLRREFEVAIEACFDAFLRVKRRSVEEKETRPWETLAELFKEGEAPLGRTKARKLLEKVHVNIYDLTDLFQIHMPPSADILQKLLTTESHRMQKLRFPGLRELAAYSVDTGRVYKLRSAKENGTLVLLLQRIRRRF
ncbi:hypothetical protein L873DRAFT_1811633 [Choiromyces venosus 120613-1]|uniref:Uncharacterized protein n=1 Tax=Choiromyces venosus 120613-1 TaxID=1336337 RepID=A0A3N4JHR8_9PEZI|nr:hypothetical protein L873DRAFT_1811633 [Choiromyces venosus 120613-1]